MSVKSSNQAAAHVLPSSREEQQIEVSLEEQDGVDRVAIRYLTWTENLGWCCQKTIRLETDQLDDLHHAITVARQRLNRKRAPAGRFTPAAQVIQLPTIG